VGRKKDDPQGKLEMVGKLERLSLFHLSSDLLIDSPKKEQGNHSTLAGR
jgi:hypothetical protein